VRKRGKHRGGGASASQKKNLKEIPRLRIPWGVRRKKKGSLDVLRDKEKKYGALENLKNYVVETSIGWGETKGKGP